MADRQETRGDRRWIITAILIFFLLLLVWCLAAFMLNSASAGALPFSFSLNSRLGADYGPDEFKGRLGVFRLSIIDDVLGDSGMPPDEVEDQSEKM